MSDDGEPSVRIGDARQVSIVARGTAALLDFLPVASGRARTRQLLKAKGVRVLRLSFDAGQLLGERVENAPMLIQTLEGRVTLNAAGEQIDMPAGAIVHLERQLPHSIVAAEASHLMVTLLGPRPVQPRTQSHASQRPPLARGAGFGSGQKRGGARTAGDGRASGQEEWAAHNLVLASTGANATAFDAITRRHTELLGQLAVRSARLLEALAGETDAAPARQELLHWARTSLLPQLRLEAEVLYPVVSLRPQQRALVAVLRQQLAAVFSAVDRLAEPGASVAFDIAASAVALRVSVGRHLAAEAELLLPTLAISSEEPLSALWERMNEPLAMPLGV